MVKVKKKLSAAQRRARKAKLRADGEWVLLNGKQVRLKLPPRVDGKPLDEFLTENADLLWLHQNEQWELIP